MKNILHLFLTQGGWWIHPLLNLKKVFSILKAKLAKISRFYLRPKIPPHLGSSAHLLSQPFPILYRFLDDTFADGASRITRWYDNRTRSANISFVNSTNFSLIILVSVEVPIPSSQFL